MAFNIVLHTIFLKLSFEIERMSRLATFVIIMTLVLSYVSIALLSLPPIALTFDIGLVSIGDRSVFTVPALLVLVGTCSVILFFEHVIFYFRSIRHMTKWSAPS